MTQPGLKIAATKLFRTSHRIGWENYLKTIVTMDPSPKTIELHAYKIQLNRLATNDHMVQIPLCWKASALLFRHWDDKTKLWWLAFVLMSQCGNIMSLPSSMEDLYHVIVCCKRSVRGSREFHDNSGHNCPIKENHYDLTKWKACVMQLNFWLRKWKFRQLKTQTVKEARKGF